MVIKISFIYFKSNKWYADKTYIKIKGIRHYLWILLDSETRVIIAFYLSNLKNISFAFKLFQKSLNNTPIQNLLLLLQTIYPLKICNMLIYMEYHNVKHHTYS